MPPMPASKPIFLPCAAAARPVLATMRGSEVPGQRVLTPLQRVALGCLRAYKVLFSPLFAGSCRFVPSCSEYAAQAVRHHGLVRGCWLAFRRLGRCHPFGAHGFDPVPRPGRHA
jgi:putative membrane protein insertion efficiency factor